MAIGIVTDSTCDLPESLIEKHAIRSVPLYINVGEESFLDGRDLSRQEFYRNLPDYESHPTTAAPSPGMLHEAYQELADEGATEVLSIHVSESLSAVVGVARLAAREEESVPVTVFDSRQLSVGTGFLVLTAARAATEGCTLEEIIKRLDDQIARTHVFAALDTLEFLRRSGRMNSVMAGLGSVLQIKPILTMYDGVPGAERVRTRRRATERLVTLLGDCLPLERVALVHTHAPQRAEELREKTQHLLSDMDVLSVDITPVIGAHIGPRAVGFACVTAKDE
jgi:DegV family protein with EDD domain